MDGAGPLSVGFLEELRREFYASDKNRLALNVLSRSDPLESCTSRNAIEATHHVFSHKVAEVKPVTYQRSSGRCWLFAALNAMRIPLAKHFELDELELSQSYLFFWDKIERCHFLLNALATAFKERGEEPEGRLVSFLLADPISDGGQWAMATNLIEKYGVMPKACFPEAHSSESSRRLNQILKSKLRQFAHELFRAPSHATTDLIKDQMKTIYRIVAICLGVPPTTFCWEYYDKSKAYHKLGPISPLQFYEEHVRPLFNVADKICIVADPRPSNPTGQTYKVDLLGNMVGGLETVYNNQPVEVLMELAAKSITLGEPVWFGCDVSKFFVSKRGLLTMDVFDFELVFDTKVHNWETKAERLTYGDCVMNHAMLLTGVNIEGTEQPTKWRVENSWGEENNAKGYICMTNDWFKEFVFEIVVDKAHCSQEVLAAQDLAPRLLPAWDPMGTLA